MDERQIAALVDEIIRELEVRGGTGRKSQADDDSQTKDSMESRRSLLKVPTNMIT